MNKTYLMLSLIICTCAHGLFAQETEQSPSDLKRFSLGLNLGTGHGRAMYFNNQAINDFGYASLSSSGEQGAPLYPLARI
ncbi:MAG: hypothetical protein JJU02_13525 [Cryomorphaceae bacterium]|nr:hypothetical protein [Cryomorphaceae bacterium]